MFRSQGGGDGGQLTFESRDVLRTMSEGKVCVFIFKDISQSMETVGQLSRLWPFSSAEL